MTVAIFGCGSVGSTIAVNLAKMNISKKIKLIDLDINKVNIVAECISKINSKIKCESIKSNLKSKKKLRKILKGVNVAINSASPQCNVTLMTSCLSCHVNYIDLASDPFQYPGIGKDTTLDRQLEFNEDFINSKLLAVTNAGASPGLSDILCKRAVEINQLDSIEQIKIYFAEVTKSNKLLLSWSPEILLLESISPATVYKNKKIVEIEFNQRRKLIKFPSPIGKIKTIIFSGHPELRTIPEFINIPVSNIEVGGGLLVNKYQIDEVILEALSKKVKHSAIFKGNIFKILATSFETADSFIENYKNGNIKKNILCCFVEIIGNKNNKILKYRVTSKFDLEMVIKRNPLATTTSFITSILPSIITKNIIEGSIKEKGVIAPAALNNSIKIIKECEEIGLNLKENYLWK